MRQPQHLATVAMMPQLDPKGPGEQMKVLQQCPGCWSFTLDHVPVGGWLECLDCGEKLTVVDLRGAGELKRCNVCLAWKPRTDFNSDSSRRDGLQGKCRLCHRRACSEAGPISRRRRERKPEQERAHAAVRSALKRGEITRPDQCEECGSEEALHGHHEDYDKPLEVEWLCGSCHRVRHGQEILDASI